ncbi:MAG: hypothetical protein R2939_12330 [Kofleriaceae bacterium]
MPGPSLPARSWWAGVVLVGALAVAPTPAASYEFAAWARTYAQVYQLRGYRLLGDDVYLPRRRFGQALTLSVWDVGELAAHRRRDRVARSGPVVSWHSHLQLDHDFGAYAAGRVSVDGATVDALDAIPELADSTLALTLTYGYLQVDGLAGDRLQVRAGRLVGIDAMDLWVVDGAEATLRPPAPLEVTVRAGLRVRDASPLASSAIELDGTSGAECQEYVEGATPGGGRWRLLDRSVVVGGAALSADGTLCPQRRAWMPTASATVASRGVRGLDARLSYRRTQSRTVGVLDAVDRLDYPDLGLYPNEAGQAPGWGVNEEHVAASVRAGGRVGAGVRVEPWAMVRQSLVHARIDRAAAGVALRRGGHRLEPEVGYLYPTFDADSIFGVFAIEPSSDLRLSWSYRDGAQPRATALAATATAWARAYHGAADDAWAWGGEAALERPVARRVWGRASALYDDGYGGRRLAATLSSRWRAGDLQLAGSVALWDVRPDELGAGDRDGVRALLGQGAASVVLGELAALHLTVDATSDRFAPLTVRTLAVVDFAFEPEM